MSARPEPPPASAQALGESSPAPAAPDAPAAPATPATPATPPAPPAAAPAAAVHPWLAVAALAQSLAEAGELVTQLHCTAEDCPPSWSHGDNGAHVFAGAEVDQVVITDGTRFSVRDEAPQ